MGLQVWLPLTKDLRNQGLLNSSAVVTGTTAFTDGKLGKALSCNGSSYWSISNITLGSSASIACWCKTTVSGKMPWVLESDANNKLNFYWATIYTLNTGDANNNPFQTDGGSNINILNDGKWHHFVVTFDGSISQLYIDGEYAGKAKNFRNPTTTNQKIKLAGGYNNGHSYDWNGAINDFRVYDYCLSPMEIKHISQGLILYYPLNRNGLGQENILKGTGLNVFASGVTDWTTTDRMGSGSGGNGTFSITEDNTCPVGIYSWNVLNNTSGNRDYQQTNQPYIGGHVYTASVYAKGTGTLFLRSWDNTSGSQLLSKTFTLTPNWEFYSWTFTATTTMETDRCSMHMGITGAGSVNMCGMKLEEGTIATSWCLNSSDTLANLMGFNELIEYDYSGYCNNSIKNAKNTYSSNAPKYNVSTFFGGVNTPKTTLSDPSILKALDNCTVAWWENCTTTGNTLLFSGQTQYYYIGAGNSSNPLYDYNIGTSGITLYKDGVAVNTSYNGQRVNHTGIYHIKDEWHHYVLTGVNLSTWTAFIINGYTSWPLNAYISDVRIYATALSESDVLSLYHNEAEIDSDGTIHGRIRS